MTWTREKLGRTGAAALAAAAISLFIVADYHPCEGLGPLWVLPFAGGVIALLASLPGITPRAMRVPGLAAATVIGFAIGLDYSSSSEVGPTGRACEPVPGFAGFALAMVWAGVLAAVGVGIAMLLAWTANALLRRPAAGTRVAGENGEG